MNAAASCCSCIHLVSIILFLIALRQCQIFIFQGSTGKPVCGFFHKQHRCSLCKQSSSWLISQVLYVQLLYVYSCRLPQFRKSRMPDIHSCRQRNIHCRELSIYLWRSSDLASGSATPHCRPYRTHRDQLRQDKHKSCCPSMQLHSCRCLAQCLLLS